MDKVFILCHIERGGQSVYKMSQTEGLTKCSYCHLEGVDKVFIMCYILRGGQIVYKVSHSEGWTKCSYCVT